MCAHAYLRGKRPETRLYCEFFLVRVGGGTAVQWSPLHAPKGLGLAPLRCERNGIANTNSSRDLWVPPG